MVLKSSEFLMLLSEQVLNEKKKNMYKTKKAPLGGARLVVHFNPISLSLTQVHGAVIAREYIFQVSGPPPGSTTP